MRPASLVSCARSGARATMRNARSRVSGENLGECDSLVVAPVSQELEPPANPGRFTTKPKGAVGSLAA